MGTWWRDMRSIYRQLRRLAGALHSGEDIRNLVQMARSFRAVELNLKAFGYDLARRMAEALPVPTHTIARHVGLSSKCSVQADIESDWIAHWARLLGVPVVYHRKLWELGYILQAIHEHGHMVCGARGLGFGCGREPITSLLAAHGIATTVTDLPGDHAATIGWARSAQHAASLDTAFHPHLIDRETFDRLVTYREADMNAIPDALADYDFCWSACAFEHLGSIAQGCDFVANSLRVVRPGGLAVHTTEFNVDPGGPTIDTGSTVLFQRHHLEALAARLRDHGHDVAPLDFELGTGPMDHFIDLPPWDHDGEDILAGRLRDPRHLKLAISSHVTTCFGIIVRKADPAR